MRNPTYAEAQTAKVAGITRTLPGVSPEQMLPHMKAEAQLAWDLYRQGKISENYMRTDGGGAMTLFNCRTVEEAKAIGDQFPLVQAGFITFEYLPLGAFTPWQGLFNDAPRNEESPNSKEIEENQP